MWDITMFKSEKKSVNGIKCGRFHPFSIAMIKYQMFLIQTATPSPLISRTVRWHGCPHPPLHRGWFTPKSLGFMGSYPPNMWCFTGVDP